MKQKEKQNKKINAVDAVLITNNEDDLQRILHRFNTISKKCNMTISRSKTKSMVILKTPRRCKLEIDDETIKQVMRAAQLLESVNYELCRSYGTPYGDINL